MVQNPMMLDELKQYDILADIDLSPWVDKIGTQRTIWLNEVVQSVYKECYENNQRIVFRFPGGDRYSTVNSKTGMFIQEFQSTLNNVDISNFFVILVTPDATLKTAYEENRSSLSSDPNPINIILSGDLITKKTVRTKKYDYASVDPLRLDIADISDRKRFLLTESKTFCMYPWIHIHAYPNGQAYPCCMSDMRYPVGNTRKHSLETIWNQDSMREIRQSMLNGSEVLACSRCYEQEVSGFFSGRKSANKHHGHHIDRVDETQEDGSLERFEMTYWDIRFSNLCNLKCRSCGHIFSSQWYQDQVKLGGPEWKERNTVLNYAGRTETDMWEQLAPHLDYVEQIYFAGGEPLLMEEHYRILDELVRRKRFDVRLIYNTNFTHTDLKGRSVFEYWSQFESVAVGASLDASGARGEYIRKGTDWAVVEQNRRDMMRICPEVDFYISPTLSIMNAMHLPDFHRDWVEKGLLKPQDLNVNILQDPSYYRIDIATAEYKQQIKHKLEQHIEWLRPQDQLSRATVGFESAINFMMQTDNTHLIDTFWRKTHELDSIRKENILDVIPELSALK
jgi:radical SAM protein with 4Fe4S-binding SPASM domain